MHVRPIRLPVRPSPSVASYAACPYLMAWHATTGASLGERLLRLLPPDISDALPLIQRPPSERSPHCPRQYRREGQAAERRQLATC